MPSLVVEHGGTITGYAVEGRLLIGRSPAADIVIPDAGVSRLHAWIGRENDHFFVQDSGGGTGTFVNGQRLKHRRVLRDDDQIEVGGARIRYLESPLPDDVSVCADYPNTDGHRQDSDHVIFDCVCGTPMVAPARFGGRTAKCRRCGEIILIPTQSRQIAARRDTAILEKKGGEKRRRTRRRKTGERRCGICQCLIEPADTVHTCPACHLPFHEECWHENFGCSAYGCSQVNSLKPGPDLRLEDQWDREISSPPVARRADDYRPGSPTIAARFPWESLFLMASVFSVLLSAVTFGVPSLLMIVAIVWFIRTQPVAKKTGFLVLSTALCIIGLVGGVGLSISWYAG